MQVKKKLSFFNGKIIMYRIALFAFAALVFSF